MMLFAIPLYIDAQVYVKESNQTRWLDPKHIKEGPIVRRELSTNQFIRIKAIQETFAEVDDSSLEEWMEDFKYDHHIEREIQTWEEMASAYSAYCTNRVLTLPQKMDVLHVVFLRSGSPEAEVLTHLDLKVLSIDDAKDILKLYKGGPKPIFVKEIP